MSKKVDASVLITVAVIVVAILVANQVYSQMERAQSVDTDLLGQWYLTKCYTFDDGMSYYETVNPNSNMEILDMVGNTPVFSGRLGTTSGFTGGEDFVGIYQDGLVTYQFQNDHGVSICMGSIEGSDLKMVEFHFYRSLSSTLWYISLCNYSKNPDSDGDFPREVPSVNTVWEAWEGVSRNYTGEVELSGSHLYIQNQIDSFFRAEMEQTVGTETVVKTLDGVFVGTFDTPEGVVNAAYAVDSTGNIWNLLIRDDVLVMRANMVSETEKFQGKPVAVTRIYSSASMVGIPGSMDLRTGLEGGWKTTYTMSVMEGGVVSVDDSSRLAVFGEDGRYVSVGCSRHESADADVIDVAYSHDGVAPDGFFCIMTDKASMDRDEVGSGIGWCKGDRMTYVLFWYDQEEHINGVTLHGFVKQ